MYPVFPQHRNNKAKYFACIVPPSTLFTHRILYRPWFSLTDLLLPISC
jgi:hypothetical protein